jgi:hypothetical protein
MRLKSVVAIVALLVGMSLLASARVGVGIVVGTKPHSGAGDIDSSDSTVEATAHF